MVALGLRLFGVDKTTAAGFSIVVFVVLTFPLFIAGAIALAASDLRITALWRSLSKPERPAPA